MTDGEAEPSKATKAVVYEFGIRWPCPRDHDPDRYEARLKMLARDCAELAPGLLRKAGDRVARIPGRFNTLPSASELHQAANELIAERAAKQAAAQRTEAQERGQPLPMPGDKAAAYARINRDQMAKGSPFVMTADGQLIKLGDLGERRGVRGDGSVIEPFFRRPGEVEGVPPGWYCRQEDARDLLASYRQHGARYTLRGAMIVEQEGN